MASGMLVLLFAFVSPWPMAAEVAAWTALEREMTVEVPPSKEECFFETVRTGQTLEVDYQVVDGGAQNQLEINFRILKPDGIPLVADFRKSDNVHRTTVKEDGDYRICFNNAASRFSGKVVFFEVIVENEAGEEEEEEEEEDELEKLFKDKMTETEHYDVQVEDIKRMLKSIHSQMKDSIKFQEMIRVFEFRDRSVAERNYERVNFWSVIHIVAMLVAGITQVVLVRSLFDEKSTLHGLWKKLC